MCGLQVLLPRLSFTHALFSLRGHSRTTGINRRRPGRAHDATGGTWRRAQTHHRRSRRSGGRSSLSGPGRGSSHLACDGPAPFDRPLAALGFVQAQLAFTQGRQCLPVPRSGFIDAGGDRKAVGARSLLGIEALAEDAPFGGHARAFIGLRGSQQRQASQQHEEEDGFHRCGGWFR